MTPPGLSLRQRVRLVFGASLILAILAVSLGVTGFSNLLEARNEVIGQVDPAITSSERVLAGLVDEENGVRAYVLSRDDTFLEPYVRGRDQSRESGAELRAYVDQVPPLIPLADRTRAAIQAWQADYAEPTIAAVAAGDPSPESQGSLDAGRDLFDEIRQAIAALQDGLQEVRAEARQELDDATRRLEATLLVSAVLLVGAVGAVWWTVRRSVELPLDELRSDARQVADGDFAHTVVPVGPTELRELAEAMELMRARIVSDLAGAEEARAALARQAAELNRANVDLGRSNTELEQFAYVASHDLQEPLRKVASFCQLLQSRYGGQLDERADQYIDFAVDGAKRMQALINDLLAFSRVGRVPEAATDVVLDDVVALALTNLATSIDESGATVTVDPLPVVRGEEALLVALFQNLIGNSVKFRRPDVSPHVEVGYRVAEEGHEVTVRDNGIGIEPEYAERIFVIFQRLHPKDRYEGTGIGLSLCRKIVEHHGGTIGVDSEPTAVGAAVRIVLPTTDRSPL